MMLVAVRFTHYSPKDSESGVKRYMICDSIDQAVAIINKVYLCGYLDDAKNDGDKGSCYLGDGCEPERGDPAGFGLTVGDYGYIEGPADQFTLWYGGTDWREVSDAYYGCTNYNWREAKSISEHDAAVLLSLGIAEDFRGQC